MMNKYLFKEVSSPTGQDSSASIQFMALKLDDIFQVTMDQRFRIMYAANVVAQAQGSKIESIRFEDWRPLLVGWDQEDRSRNHQIFCQRTREGIDDVIDSGKPLIKEFDSKFIDGLNSHFPLVSSLDIDMDGYAFTWSFYFKYDVWEGYVPEPALFMSMDQLLGDSYE